MLYQSAENTTADPTTFAGNSFVDCDGYHRLIILLAGRPISLSGIEMVMNYTARKLVRKTSIYSVLD